MQQIFHEQFPNGVTLLGERMPHVRSAAFLFCMPAGCAYDPPGSFGLASVVSDIIMRGAGNFDSRALTESLDALGVDRSESVGAWLMHFGGATLARNLLPAISIYADILRRPHLAESELDPVRSLALQDLQGLEDEPQAKVMIELRKRHYPEPLGRDPRGAVEDLRALSIDAIRNFYRRHFDPHAMIVAVAGDIDWNRVRDHIGDLFGDWPAKPVSEPPIASRGDGSGHLAKTLDQTQIGIAFASVPMSHQDFYAARGAVGVLSEGMSSRLFTNIREKHGLCYAIGARYETMRERGNIVCYTAGRPEKAQELLQRTLHELTNLANGVEDEELHRVKAGLKSALIMRQESTSARAGAIASDWHLLGRVRTNAEMQAAVNALQTVDIVEHLRRFPPRDFTIVTLGPEALRY